MTLPTSVATAAEALSTTTTTVTTTTHLDQEFQIARATHGDMRGFFMVNEAAERNAAALSEAFDVAMHADVGASEAQNAISNSATGNSRGYVRAQGCRVEEFLQAGRDNPSLAKFMEIVDDNLNKSVVASPTDQPLFVKLINKGGNPFDTKAIGFMNRLLLNWFWHGLIKNEEKPPQPGTIATYYRSLLSAMKRHFGLPYYPSNFKGFDGSFESVTKEAMNNWARRDPTYGTCPTRTEFTDEHCEIVKNYIKSDRFNIHNPVDLRQLLYFVLGFTCALRAREEHYSLEFSHFRFGTYESGHELAGMEYVQCELPSLLSKGHNITLGK